MRKILVYDHDFNIESISSCSKANGAIRFYRSNKNMSFNDNLDIINPDCIWINKSFADINVSDVKNNPIKIIEYELPYIIPNSFADIHENSENIISCVLFNDSQPISDRVYMYNELYVRFYTVGDALISHTQYCGQLNNCKDLTEIIMSSKKIIADSDIIKNMCSFYRKEYALFKPKGTLSWSATSMNTTNNMELFLSNENQ